MAASASSSPDPTTSAGFSSTPINPVVAHRRPKSDGSWRNGDSQNQKAANGGSSSSGTPDEDIRSKNQTPKQEDAPTPETQNQSQNQTLPSLSSGGAALLQLREHANSNNPSSNRLNTISSDGDAAAGSKLPPQTSANAGTTAQAPSFRRSSSGPREEGNPLIPDEDSNEDEEVDDVEDEDPSAPPSPTDQREMRVMFRGREVFVEDLIGLRVAKTFAGHGRFLGQVVKFDKRVAMYTVVYADGDAEDLTVEATVQIVIQDEIERADPAQPPPAVSLLFKKAEDDTSPAGPDTGEFMMQPPRQPTQRRTRIQVSEREAQFVISLFENHALPSLVRQGWHVERNRGFLSPVGEIFPSALDVVGYIASDNQLLTACFPANVHSAILSLLPPDAHPAVADTSSTHGSTGSASRKRTTSDSPAAQQLDGKRTRPTRQEAYALPVRASAARGGEAARFHADDLERHVEAARIAAYRGQAMGGRIRMSGDRFISGKSTSEARIQAPPNARGYRSEPSRDPTLENPFTSRWPGADPATVRIDAEYARRFADSPGWRERAESYGPDRPLEAHSRNRIRAEGRYINRMSVPTEAGEGVGASKSGAHSGYFRDSTGSSPGSQASPMTNSSAYPQYRSRAGDYQSSEMASRITAVPRVSRETASFMSPTDTLGASAAFSMVDVDRISKSRPGSAHPKQQPRGRSPHQGEGQHAFLQHQSLDNHRRTNNGQSFHRQRGGEGQGHYGAEPTSEAQGEQHNSAASVTSGAPTQQQHE